MFHKKLLEEANELFTIIMPNATAQNRSPIIGRRGEVMRKGVETVPTNMLEPKTPYEATNPSERREPTPNHKLHPELKQSEKSLYMVAITWRRGRDSNPWAHEEHQFSRLAP